MNDFTFTISKTRGRITHGKKQMISNGRQKTRNLLKIANCLSSSLVFTVIGYTSTPLDTSGISCVNGNLAESSSIELQVSKIQANNSLSLEGAVKLAEANRSAVLAARKLILSAEKLKQSLGSYLPTRVEAGFASRPDIQAGEDLLIAQPIDFFGRVSSSKSLGSAGVDKANAAFRQVELDVQSQALSAYADAAAAQRQNLIAKMQLDIGQQIYDGTKQKVDVGDTAPGQLLRAELDLNRLKTAAVVKQQAFKSAILRLDSALGTSISENTQLAFTDLPNPSGTIENRPDIESDLADIRTAKANRVISSLSSAPTFEMQFRRSPWSTPELYNLRAQISWPIWDHGASRNLTQSADEQIKASTLALTDLRGRAQKELDAAKIEDQSAIDASTSFAKLETTAQSLLEKTQKAFSLGGATLLDVLDAERVLQEIQQSEVDALLSAAKARATYYSASGTLLFP